MSSSYAERKLVEAIAEAGGSPTAARRLVLAWAARDPRLLQELTQPFLTGIVGHAVDRAIRTMPKVRKPQPAGSLGASALDGVIRALSENFAHSDRPQAEEAARPAASAAHADVIRGLAKAQVRRRAIAFDQASSARR
jgi:hypothetical protein